MLIVIIAMTIVSLPIAISIIFMIYKTYIYFTQRVAKAQIETPMENLNFSVSSRADNDEIAVVIAAAVNVYLRK